MPGKLAIIALTLIAWSGAGLAQGTLFDRGRDVLRGFGSDAPGTPGLAESEIARGLREALRLGSERVVGTLGVNDGFNARPDVHIPLPGSLRTVQTTLARIGMSGMVDDLELRLNRGAEAAVPRAKSLFLEAIERMTLDDARNILSGPNDAATEYFRGKMSAPLAAAMRPIVDQELAGVGALRSYESMMGRYRAIPFVPDVKADLTGYVLEKAIGGVFLYLAREEAAIRENPARRTTELLQKVFGAR